MSGPWQGWDPPAGTAGWSDFHWWKIPSGRVLQLIMVSEAPLGYSGHFTRGRMGPCYGEGCKLCLEGIGVQLRYLVAAVEPGTRRVGIWDVGRSVALELRDLASSRGGLVGLWIQASHHSHSKQSRTEIEVVETKCPSWVIQIEPPNVVRALVSTWQKQGSAIPDGFERAAGSVAKKGSVRAKIQSSIESGKNRA